MDFKPPEIVKLLKKQRRFYQEQLRLIDIALAAIDSGKKTARQAPGKQDGKGNTSKRHRIQWTREIERFLDDYDQFTIMDLQSDLADKRGITAAMTIQGRNVMNNTLNRFEKKGRIRRIQPGVYQVVKESLPT